MKSCVGQMTSRTPLFLPLFYSIQISIQPVLKLVIFYRQSSRRPFTLQSSPNLDVMLREVQKQIPISPPPFLGNFYSFRQFKQLFQRNKIPSALRKAAIALVSISYLSLEVRELYFFCEITFLLQLFNLIKGFLIKHSGVRINKNRIIGISLLSSSTFNTQLCCAM